MFKRDQKLRIEPHQAVGPIRFGMSREAVARTLGQTPRRAKPIIVQPNDTEFFFENSLNVGYDDDDLCAEVGFSEYGKWSVEYGGFTLFAHTALEIVQWAKSLDPSLQVKAGFVSEPLGIAMHADWVDSNDAGYRQEMIAKPPPTLAFFRPDFREASEKAIGRLLRERYLKKKDA